MPQSLGPIPLDVPIVEPGGSITVFFRLRWQQLIDGFTTSPTIESTSYDTQTAAIATATVHTTLGAGRYRINWYMRKTVADGVSSSLTLTTGWTESGVSLTEAAAALTTDTTTAQQSGSKVVDADASSDLTIAVAYASNTPNRMTYRLRVDVEKLA